MNITKLWDDKMSCKNCEKEDKEIKKCNEFGEKLRQLVDEYNLEIPAESIAFSLILEAKIEMCCSSACFHHMLGVLSSFLHEGIDSMWEEMKPNEEDE